MSRVVAITKRTFSALSVPNFRLFFFGQSTSLVGTWMQSVAQSWLVFTVTHSATAIGLVLASANAPGADPRSVWRGHRGPCQQAPAAHRPAVPHGCPSPRARSACGDSRGGLLGDLRPRDHPGAQQLLRNAGAPGVHARDGRAQAGAQRREPQLDHGQCSAGCRPGDRRTADRHRRRGGVFPGERRQLHRRRRFTHVDGSHGAPAEVRRRTVQRDSCARAFVTWRELRGSGCRCSWPGSSERSRTSFR